MMERISFKLMDCELADKPVLLPYTRCVVVPNIYKFLFDTFGVTDESVDACIIHAAAIVHNKIDLISERHASPYIGKAELDYLISDEFNPHKIMGSYFRTRDEFISGRRIIKTNPSYWDELEASNTRTDGLLEVNPGVYKKLQELERDLFGANHYDSMAWLNEDYLNKYEDKKQPKHIGNFEHIGSILKRILGWP